MRRLFLVFLLLFALVSAWSYATQLPADFPFEEGDLIFQTSRAGQTPAVVAATRSPYSHVGIVRKRDGKFVVLEAQRGVEETPIADWPSGGWFGRVAVYRDVVSTPAQKRRMIAEAEKYLGRPYDPFFLFGNAAIYCSELPYLAYKAMGIPVGKVQRISELHIENSWSQGLIERRGKRHPLCLAHPQEAPFRCYQRILEQQLITPASLAADARFVRVYTNYPF